MKLGRKQLKRKKSKEKLMGLRKIATVKMTQILF